MPQDTDPQREAEVAAERAEARTWARSALADARRRFDPAARAELRARLGLPPAPVAR